MLSLLKKALNYVKESDGFMTAAGQYLDYVEWHVFCRGMILPFLAVCFHAWFSINLVLYVDALLVPFAMGLDIVEEAGKYLERLVKESHYFLLGHVPVFIGYGLWKLAGNPLMQQLIHVCL